MIAYIVRAKDATPDPAMNCSPYLNELSRIKRPRFFGIKYGVQGTPQLTV